MSLFVMMIIMNVRPHETAHHAVITFDNAAELESVELFIFDMPVDGVFPFEVAVPSTTVVEIVRRYIFDVKPQPFASIKELTPYLAQAGLSFLDG